MPTYQYVCTDCGEPLEAVQKFSDDALTECPACGGRLRKVFSAVGVVFKGSGFYRNDSRSTTTSSTPASSSTSNGKDSSSSSSDSAKSSSDSSTKTSKDSSSGSKASSPAA
ncbi:FmdB family zinc ribbon protein [Jiangella endophytica]|uniref:FmdB family zinc ribbon protein n=1 Tax=Jiangella endophytica TaxID=1623398 RepID=UPI000E345F6E|nr:FmdB family zinc ribbon protein [Jiangella endophytica]